MKKVTTGGRLNKTQQRRTKEQGTQITQNTTLEEDTHEEGDEMRATQTRPRACLWLAYTGQSHCKKIHGDGGEMAANYKSDLAHTG